MSTAQPRSAVPSVSFYQDSIGKKAVMAVSGAVLFGFTVAHLLGNLQVFLGPEAFNAYARSLREVPALLWGVRVALLGAVSLHVWSSIRLAGVKRAARPVAYHRWRATESTYASRTMMWSGPIVGAFVVYHLLHLTFGAAHPAFDHGDVYRNFVIGFSSPLVVAAYVVAVALLGLHLRHGIWSMLQSMGFSHPRYTPRLKTLASAAALAMVLLYISMPLAVLAGIIR